jgi:hypothetical protein
MPFRSKKQIAKFAELEKQGKLKPGTTAKWLKETPNPKALPKRVNSGKTNSKA